MGLAGLGREELQFLRRPWPHRPARMAPQSRFLLVIEVKSEIADAQALLGSLDVKVRVGPQMARSLGLGPVRAVLPLLLVAEGTTNRERVRRLAPLFERFATRGRQAVSWLHRPDAAVSGLLIFTDLRFATGGRVTRVAPHRIRMKQPNRSVTGAHAESSAAPAAT